MQPFLNYNFEGGAYLTTAPIMTANWEARGSQVWTVPMGAGAGKLFKIGRLPVNTQFGGFTMWSTRFCRQLADPRASAVDVSLSRGSSAQTPADNRFLAGAFTHTLCPL